MVMFRYKQKSLEDANLIKSFVDSILARTISGSQMTIRQYLADADKSDPIMIDDVIEFCKCSPRILEVNTGLIHEEFLPKKIDFESLVGLNFLLLSWLTVNCQNTTIRERFSVPRTQTMFFHGT